MKIYESPVFYIEMIRFDDIITASQTLSEAVFDVDGEFKQSFGDISGT